MKIANLQAILDAPGRDGVQHLRSPDGRSIVLKRRSDLPQSFVEAEAHGLQTLASTSGLPVPAVLGLGRHAIAIEDLGRAAPCADFAQIAGRGLAQQHRQHNPRFGFEHPGWCGDSPQDNDWHPDGHCFFAERRLLPQMRRALQAGRMDRRDARDLETLCARLSERVPAQPAVLLHGDLWTGNLHSDRNGRPALIDAGAVHYGWAEAELAMLILFGEPAPAFFAAYAELAPLAADWRQRAPLYNLYHLLNHLNLFGDSYRPAVRSAIERCR